MDLCKVFIVDDHPIVRYGITQVINHEDDMMVCGDAGTIVEAKKKIHKTKPDIVLLDISLNDESGIELLKYINRKHREMFVLMISMLDELHCIQNSIQAGARGYFHKDDEILNIPFAIRKVMNQDMFFSNNISMKLMQSSSETLKRKSLEYQLTKRELEVLDQLAKGKRRNQIAKEMFITSKTVSAHIENIKKKLNLSSTDEVSQFAIQRNQIDSNLK